MGRVGLQDSGCDPRDSFKRVTVCVNDVHESTKARQLTHCEHRQENQSSFKMIQQ